MDADVRFGPDDRHAVPPLHYVCDAAVEPRGLFGATALHWAAMMALRADGRARRGASIPDALRALLGAATDDAS